MLSSNDVIYISILSVLLVILLSVAIYVQTTFKQIETSEEVQEFSSNDNEQKTNPKSEEAKELFLKLFSFEHNKIIENKITPSVKKNYWKGDDSDSVLFYNHSDFSTVIPSKTIAKNKMDLPFLTSNHAILCQKKNQSIELVSMSTTGQLKIVTENNSLEIDGTFSSINRTNISSWFAIDENTNKIFLSETQQQIAITESKKSIGKCYFNGKYLLRRIVSNLFQNKTRAISENIFTRKTKIIGSFEPCALGQNDKFAISFSVNGIISMLSYSNGLQKTHELKINNVKIVFSVLNDPSTFIAIDNENSYFVLKISNEGQNELRLIASGLLPLEITKTNDDMSFYFDEFENVLTCICNSDSCVCFVKGFLKKNSLVVNVVMANFDKSSSFVHCFQNEDQFLVARLQQEKTSIETFTRTLVRFQNK